MAARLEGIGSSTWSGFLALRPGVLFFMTQGAHSRQLASSLPACPLHGQVKQTGRV